MSVNYKRSVIRCLNVHAAGERYFWCGAQNCWVPGIAFATFYTDKEKANLIRDRKVPNDGEWEAVAVTAEAFAARYKTTLLEAHRRNKLEFMCGLDEIGAIADDVVARLRTGDAEIREYVEKVAKSFGIPATRDSLQKFLNASQQPGL